MKGNFVERYRRHVLPADQLKGAVDALIILLESANAGAEVVITKVGVSGPDTVAKLPQAVVEVILDAVSLMAARERVTLVCVDDTRSIKSREAAEIFDCDEPDLFRLLKALKLPHRKDNHGQSYTISTLLDAFQRQRSKEAS